MEIKRKREEKMRVFSFKITTGDGILEIGAHHPWILVHVRGLPRRLQT